VRAGDVLIGIASSGPHSNGYSLVRKILARAGNPLDLDLGGVTLADALMEPTRIYVKPVLELLAQHDAIHAMAHVTGGALVEKIIRVVPKASACTSIPRAGRCRRCSTGCSAKATWRAKKCGAPSTAASATC
jgi:phosphoribosylaminoimidazole (AIR) synthetase